MSKIYKKTDLEKKYTRKSKILLLYIAQDVKLEKSTVNNEHYTKQTNKQTKNSHTSDS